MKERAKEWDVKRQEKDPTHEPPQWVRHRAQIGEQGCILPLPFASVQLDCGCQSHRVMTMHIHPAHQQEVMRQAHVYAQ